MTKLIKCPVCRGTYSHHQPPYLIRGYGSEDTALPTHPGYECCGEGVVIPFVGECGHTWEMIIGQHKGETEVVTLRGADLCSEKVAADYEVAR